MNRIFWGLVKIALLVGVLVLAARFIMSDKFDEMFNAQPEAVEMEEIEVLEEPVEVEEEVTKSAAPLMVRSASPVTALQYTYYNYSQWAGMPEAFSASFTVMGSEYLSSQIAREVGEPTGDWGIYANHKKTFWILSELTLRGINVDDPMSASGTQIVVDNGEISVYMANVDEETQVLPSAGMDHGGPVMEETAPENVDAPVAKETTTKKRTMRSINWEEVVEAGQR